MRQAQPLSKTWEDVYHANLANALFAPDGELINHTFTLQPFFTMGERAITNPVRGFREEFSNVMADWILGGDTFVTEDMIAMNPNAAKFGTVFEAPHLHEADIVTAYGPRIVPQLNYVLSELARDPNSRRACVMVLGAEDRYVAEALGQGKTNCEYICTYGFNFRIRKGALDMVVSMRSNNYTTTVCQDVYVFSRIQEWLAVRLGVSVGMYYHSAVSGHVLENERERAAEILRVYIKDAQESEANWPFATPTYDNGWRFAADALGV